jgi:putative Mn2+ efflux pump MntP
MLLIECLEVVFCFALIVGVIGIAFGLELNLTISIIITVGFVVIMMIGYWWTAKYFKKQQKKDSNLHS